MSGAWTYLGQREILRESVFYGMLTVVLIVLAFAAQYWRSRLPARNSPLSLVPMKWIDRAVKGLTVLSIISATCTVWFLPPFVIPAFDLLTRYRRFVVLGTAVLLALIVLLEYIPLMHKTVRRMRFNRIVLDRFLKPIAVAGMVLILLLIEPEHVKMRNFILSNLAISGILTGYRQWRGRWRSNDRSLVSLIGGITVVIQFLALIVLIVMIAAPLLMVLLMSGRLLEGRDLWKAWLECISLFLSSTTIIYVIFYFIRRLTGARGFSWWDPPNWRTALPHLKYTIALRPTRRFPYLRIAKSGLANTVRAAYIRHIVTADTDNLDEAIDRAAQITPSRPSKQTIAFSILGDPGEGDDSQLYNYEQKRQRTKQEKQNVKQQAGSGGPGRDAAPDFMLISSDVVYPSGESMDYERCVYRPYHKLRIPIYAIPGNHDWYDHLNGFFMNFAFAAAKQPQGELGAAHPRWGGYSWAGPRRRWRQIARLRKRYRLFRLGGFSKKPLTQQRLSFFELCFEDAPLTVLGVDTGCTGSVDPLQFAWLERRLTCARTNGHLIFVLLSEPLYVNGEFAGQPKANSTPQAPNNYGLSEIYALLRANTVEIVMAGDTHAYERYEVWYATADGKQRTMHHIVNGGGGAYLALPMNFHWRIDHVPGMSLATRFVFQDPQTHQYDEVFVHGFFPTAAHLLDKFLAAPQAGIKQGRLASAYVSLMLRFGFTNGLDHDTSPLLQSYITAQFLRATDPPGRWTLIVTPWFSTGENNQLEPQADRLELSVQVNQSHVVAEFP